MPKTYSCNKWKSGRCKMVVCEDVGNCPKCGEDKSRGKACSDYQETGNVGSLELATFAVDKNALSAVRQSPTNIKSFP